MTDTGEPTQDLVDALRGAAVSALPRYLTDLAHLVGIDSGSYSPAGVNRVAEWFAGELAALGFTVDTPPIAAERPGQVGDLLVARRPGSRPVSGKRILLAGHMDTVFDDGTAAHRPFRLDAPLARGPGVCDDKGGLLAGLTAVRLLHELGIDDYRELVFLAVPDEEIGSPASRPVTEAVARDVDHALVLECARENGDLVTARKGVADFVIQVTGRPAHAGIEPERGANAALAAAHLLITVQGLDGLEPGVTVNVGTVRAGTRTNIVCPSAELRLEVRFPTEGALERVRHAITTAARALAVPGTGATVTQLDHCPPMEHTPAAGTMLATARRIAHRIDLRLGAAATGGVGDANIIAGAGVPTLDGLGPVGGGDHTPHEWLDITTAPDRIALLAALIAELGGGHPPARS